MLGKVCLPRRDENPGVLGQAGGWGRITSIVNYSPEKWQLVWIEPTWASEVLSSSAESAIDEVHQQWAGMYLRVPVSSFVL
jgi:hypothetical protein